MRGLKEFFRGVGGRIGWPNVIQQHFLPAGFSDPGLEPRGGTKKRSRYLVETKLTSLNLEPSPLEATGDNNKHTAACDYAFMQRIDDEWIKVLDHFNIQV